jgi:protein-disulfide isomerase
MEAMQELQRRDQASAEEKTSSAIKSKKDQIYNDPNTPVGGNPKGDVTIVEFSDFQCGYCKMSEPFIEKILKEDKNVRFVYKDFPVLGPASMTAARVALAVFKIGGVEKYVKFHDELLAKKEHLNDDIIYDTAKAIGLDTDKLKKEAESEATQKQVQTNLDLGTDIGVRGTPMFIIGSQVYPGALQYDQLKKAIDEARSAKSKG